MALAANFLVIEEGADGCVLGGSHRQQGAQPGMAGGEIVELTVGQVFVFRPPKAAFLCVVDVEFKAQDIPRRTIHASRQQVKQLRLGGLPVFSLA